MFRARGEEYVDPSRAKVEEEMQRKIREQAEKHFKKRESDLESGSNFSTSLPGSPISNFRQNLLGTLAI